MYNDTDVLPFLQTFVTVTLIADNYKTVMVAVFYFHCYNYKKSRKRVRTWNRSLALENRIMRKS